MVMKVDCIIDVMSMFPADSLSRGRAMADIRDELCGDKRRDEGEDGFVEMKRQCQEAQRFGWRFGGLEVSHLDFSYSFPGSFDSGS